MSNTLIEKTESLLSRRASDRGASADASEFPILDAYGDIVRADRRIPEKPRSNVEVEWLPVAMEVRF